jgi:hypothetical protein
MSSVVGENWHQHIYGGDQPVHLNLVATKFMLTTLRYIYLLLSNTELNLLKREVTFTFPLEMNPEM